MKTIRPSNQSWGRRAPRNRQELHWKNQTLQAQKLQGTWLLWNTWHQRQTRSQRQPLEDQLQKAGSYFPSRQDLESSTNWGPQKSLA